MAVGGVERDRPRRPRSLLILAAVIGAAFGAMAVGVAGFGVSSLWSGGSSALTSGMILGTGILLAACLLWNLDLQVILRRETRLAPDELAAAHRELAEAEHRLERVRSDLEGRSYGQGDGFDNRR